MQVSWDSYDEALAAALERGGPAAVGRIRVGKGRNDFKFVVTTPDTTDQDMWELTMQLRLGRELTPEEKIAVSLMPAGVQA